MQCAVRCDWCISFWYPIKKHHYKKWTYDDKCTFPNIQIYKRKASIFGNSNKCLLLLEAHTHMYQLTYIAIKDCWISLYCLVHEYQLHSPSCLFFHPGFKWIHNGCCIHEYVCLWWMNLFFSHVIFYSLTLCLLLST